MDEAIGKRFQSPPVPADHEPLVKRHRDLLPGRLRPIENRAGGEDSPRDPDDPNPPLAYGWPQCGQTGLNISLVVCPHCKKERLEGGRVSTKSGYRKPDTGKKKRGRDRDLLSIRFPQSEIRNS